MKKIILLLIPVLLLVSVPLYIRHKDMTPDTPENENLVSNTNSSEKESDLFASNPPCLFELDIENGNKKSLLQLDSDIYQYGSLSPDKKWIAFLKVSSSSGEGEMGSPSLYSLETNKFKELGNKFITFLWDAQWSKDSSSILLGNTCLLNVKTWKTQELSIPEGYIPMGGKPSADGSRIALFIRKDISYQEGALIKLLIFDGKGKMLKNLNTPIVSDYSRNILMPVLSGFDWLDNNENILIENWNVDTLKCDVYVINTYSGKYSKRFRNVHSPVPSPDGRMIAAFGMTSPGRSANRTEVKVFDKTGMLLCDIPQNVLDVEGFEISRIMWAPDSSKLFFWGCSNKEKSVVIFDLNEKLIKKVPVDYNAEVIGISRDGKKIIYLD